ncbi:UDP-glucose 4-epimerase GalE [Macrococcus lamae]|uniref:UDP-glucose 4-epimerase n=1 Tax=Macrococcus lamae TaxID=198484 RepID=A0A4R6BS77_9STAP|nr:UDP-glucose 4-epimerase GalE [Macrococcus lamae]TDM05239.1 UDP-glucose 4-epimerase GalE [Macrococcus lamae]
MKILVLGGAGYIGSHAVYQLIENHMEVVVVDNLETGHRAAVHKDAVFYEGDLRDKAFLRDVFEKEKIDGVLHFAAYSLVGESVQQPMKYFNNNTYGAQVLLEVMNEFNVNYIVFSSTAATYGEPKTIPITEDEPTLPTNPYGESKLMMEKMMKWNSNVTDLNYVALRYFNVAGAREDGVIGEDHSPETHLIPIVIEAALGQRDHVTIFGDDYDTADGTCIRDYIHVEDLINAHLLALDYLIKGGTSDVFNLGSSRGFSVKEIIDTVETVTDIKINRIIGERRAGDPGRLVASADKAKAVLKWNPTRTEINQIITDAWNWHSNNPQGWDDK